MPTPCYISITGQTQGNITAGAFTADSVGNIYVQGHEDIADRICGESTGSDVPLGLTCN